MLPVTIQSTPGVHPTSQPTWMTGLRIPSSELNARAPVRWLIRRLGVDLVCEAAIMREVFMEPRNSLALFIYGTILSELWREAFLAELQWKSVSPPQCSGCHCHGYKFYTCLSCLMHLSHAGGLSEARLSALGRHKKASSLQRRVLPPSSGAFWGRCYHCTQPLTALGPQASHRKQYLSPRKRSCS